MARLLYYRCCRAVVVKIVFVFCRSSCCLFRFFILFFILYFPVFLFFFLYFFLVLFFFASSLPPSLSSVVLVSLSDFAAQGTQSRSNFHVIDREQRLVSIAVSIRCCGPHSLPAVRLTLRRLSDGCLLFYQPNGAGCPGGSERPQDRPHDRGHRAPVVHHPQRRTDSRAARGPGGFCTRARWVLLLFLLRPLLQQQSLTVGLSARCERSSFSGTRVYVLSA